MIEQKDSFGHAFKVHRNCHLGDLLSQITMGPKRLILNMKCVQIQKAQLKAVPHPTVTDIGTGRRELQGF